MRLHTPTFAPVLRPWHRFFIQREIEATRASLTERSCVDGLRDDSCRYCTLPWEDGGCVLHVIAGRGRSLEGINHLARQIVPRVMKTARRWLFLVETSAACPGEEFRDQYSLARSIARRLQIAAPLNPFASITNEEVIRTAMEFGLPLGVTPDDLYGALCYDCLPKRRDSEPVQKSLELAKIHEDLHPRREAMRLLRQFQWDIDLSRLEDIVTHLLHRFETESPWVLDEFYDNQVRPLLAQVAQHLNRVRLKEWLERGSPYQSVLMVMDEQHLPLALPA